MAVVVVVVVVVVVIVDDDVAAAAAAVVLLLLLFFIIIIIILVITFLQGIYNYVPETNHLSRVYSVAAVLYLQFVLHVTLFHA
jgi:hypothetical protein